MINFIAVATKSCDRIPDPFSDKLPLTSADNFKTLSICQDIVALHSKGKKLTPKGVALGMTLRHMTASSEVSKIVHGLGHAPSYDSLERMETAIAAKQLNYLSSDNLPIDMQHGTLTSLVCDNIDFAEETLSGVGTTHNTNSIIFQSPGELSQSESSVTATARASISKRARAFRGEQEVISEFLPRKRHGPKLVLECTTSLASCQDQTSKSFDTDLIYCFCKFASPMETPGWTGFNISLRDATYSQTIIHYLPVLESPATESKTVDKLLQNAVKYCNILELPAIVVVFDQALYAKAQEIRWTQSQPKIYEEKLVLRMGEFHTCMAFLATIGKRFSKSGLEDIFIESEVFAKGSINRVMNGHKYNRSVRGHKLINPDLSQLRIEQLVGTLSEPAKAEFQEAIKQMEIGRAHV